MVKLSRRTGLGLLLLGIAAAGAGIWFYQFKNQEKTEWQKITVETGDFQVSVPANGSIQPEHKIIVMPPVPGRIDQILADEGMRIQKGQIIAWMSSTDRAALIDASRAQNKDETDNVDWETVYKATPIVAPVSGQIISRSVVEGQTVGAATEIMALSDRLVVRAQIDETDIGKVFVGQEAEVLVDAFPGAPVLAKVSRIGHQSAVVNNINMFEVQMVPVKLPKELRAGMTATVKFITARRKEAVLLPAFLAQGQQNANVDVMILGGDGKPVPLSIKIGLSNGEKVEVLEGLKAQDVVLSAPLKLQNNDALANPFGVMGGRRNSSGQTSGGGGRR